MNRGPTVTQWLEKRIRLSEIVEFLRHKRVPTHHKSLWYFLGGVCLFLFLVQVVTGILLLMYYKPGEESSYESVKFIVSSVPFGWLIRSIHSWSANLMILAAFLHLFSVFFMRAYRDPRELTWLSGFILLSFSLAFGFSGYLLPWNELSYFATKVGTDIAGSIPGAGDFLLRIVRGGEDVTDKTLIRFFGFHVAILPGLFSSFLFIHLFLIQRQGISEPPSWEKKPPEKRVSLPFYPDFVLRESLVWLLVFNLILILCFFFPWELGNKADPLAPAPPGIKPEWYFMFMFQTLKMIPSRVVGIEGEILGILFFTAGGLLLFLFPFIDRTRMNTRAWHFITICGIIVLAYIIAFTALGYYVSSRAQGGW